MWHSVKMRNAQSDSKVAGLVVDSIPKRSWHEIEENLCELVRRVESRMVHTGTNQHGLFWV